LIARVGANPAYHQGLSMVLGDVRPKKNVGSLKIVSAPLPCLTGDRRMAASG